MYPTKPIFLLFVLEIFAKPFVAALSGHIDGVNAMARHPTRQNSIISGGNDGGNCWLI